MDFADDIFKCIFLNENVWISIKISLKFVPKGPINNIPTMVQIISEPMMVSLPTHICVARPQWVKTIHIACVKNSNPTRSHFAHVTNVQICLTLIMKIIITARKGFTWFKLFAHKLFVKWAPIVIQVFFVCLFDCFLFVVHGFFVKWAPIVIQVFFCLFVFCRCFC